MVEAIDSTLTSYAIKAPARFIENLEMKLKHIRCLSKVTIIYVFLYAFRAMTYILDTLILNVWVMKSDKELENN